METEILRRIITLNIAKIRYYLKEIRASKDFLEAPVLILENCVKESLQSMPYFDASAVRQFLEWLAQVFSIRNLPLEPEPKDLIPCIRWAQEAKKHYLKFLKAAFSTQTKQLPRWICTVFKLGRYGIACRVMVQLALEFPALFNPMTVQSVVAPALTNFTLNRQELPLTCVLRGVAASSAEEHHSRLARIWNTADPEDQFRRVCSLNLRVHAEMQLLSYYDHNSQSRPSFRFIGVSKKACYLCHMFLATHPGSFVTSSCHEKLYVSWIAPPAADSKVYRKNKAFTIELSKIMEGAAKQDLKNRLGGLKRAVPADLTAGVSLSGLTNYDLARMASQDLTRSRRDSVESSNDTPMPIVPMEKSVDSKQVLSPIEVITISRNEESCLDRGGTPPITAVVFHFTRADSTKRQDIVSIGDILDLYTNHPSWEKLVRILEANDGVSLGFKEDREFLMING